MSSTCGLTTTTAAKMLQNKKHHFVHHEYQDHYLQEQEEDKAQDFDHKATADNDGVGSAVTATIPPPPPIIKSTTLGRPKGGQFAVKLYQMLQESTEGGTDHILSWQPHGRAFLIRRQNDFSQEILPLYFKHQKITSFQRQLSLYGFKKLIGKGLDQGSYYHELFLKGRPDLLHRIERCRVKGTGTRPKYSPETEPKFYEMAFCGVTDVPAVVAPGGSTCCIASIKEEDLATSPINVVPREEGEAVSLDIVESMPDAVASSGSAVATTAATEATTVSDDDESVGGKICSDVTSEDVTEDSVHEDDDEEVLTSYLLSYLDNMLDAPANEIFDEQLMVCAMLDDDGLISRNEIESTLHGSELMDTFGGNNCTHNNKTEESHTTLQHAPDSDRQNDDDECFLDLDDEDEEFLSFCEEISSFLDPE